MRKGVRWVTRLTCTQVTAGQLQAVEAAAYRLLQSALAEHREEARVARVAEAPGSQPQPLSQQPRCGSDASSRAWLVLSCVPERLACALLEEDVQRRQAAAESARATNAGAQEEEQAEVVDVKGKGAAVAHSKVCCNPACTSLGGPSALIAPGCGKTCARCKAVTYCCGACQLAHWGAAGGGHARVCPKLAQAGGVVIVRRARTPLLAGVPALWCVEGRTGMAHFVAKVPCACLCVSTGRTGTVKRLPCVTIPDSRFGLQVGSWKWSAARLEFSKRCSLQVTARGEPVVHFVSFRACERGKLRRVPIFDASFDATPRFHCLPGAQPRKPVLAIITNRGWTATAVNP